MDKRLSRDEAWDFMYRVRPYLDGVADEELSLRLADVLRNLYTLTAEGKVGALAPDQGGLIWLERFAHLLLEYRRRNKKLEEMVRPEDVPFNRASASALLGVC